jgi:diacylglycerol kinase (ATP)
MKKIAVIVNHAAGRKSGFHHALAAKSKLWGRGCDFFSPTSLQDLQKIYLDLSPSEYEALVVIGGDGTMNQVIRSIPESPNSIPVYPFPAGTANDLANELGLRSDWHQVQTLVDEKRHGLIDLIQVNESRFATVGGIGVGPIFTRQFNHWRKRSELFGKIAQNFHSQIYTMLATQTIIFGSGYTHYLHICGSSFDEKIKTPAVFFCNQTNIGGNIKVAPPIDNTDQRFNVLVITSCNRINILKAMAEAKLGKIPDSAIVFSTDHLFIRDLNNREISTFGDGEPLVSDSTLEFRILPKSLRVYRETAEEKSKWS